MAGADLIVENYCRRGVAVQYERAPFGEHIEYAARGGVLAAVYLSDRFAGRPVPNDLHGEAPTRSPRARSPSRLERQVAGASWSAWSGRRLVLRKRRVVTIRGLAPGRHTVRLRVDGRKRVRVVRRAAC